MTIHIDPARVNITPSLPKEPTTRKYYNPVNIVALCEAIDDGDTESQRHEDGLPTERTWNRIVNLARRLEAGK